MSPSQKRSSSLYAHSRLGAQVDREPTKQRLRDCMRHPNLDLCRRADHVGTDNAYLGPIPDRAQGGAHCLDGTRRVGIRSGLTSSLPGSRHHFDLSPSDDGNLDDTDEDDDDEGKDERELDYGAAPGHASDVRPDACHHGVEQIGKSTAVGCPNDESESDGRSCDDDKGVLGSGLPGLTVHVCEIHVLPLSGVGSSRGELLD